MLGQYGWCKWSWRFGWGDWVCQWVQEVSLTNESIRWEWGFFIRGHNSIVFTISQQVAKYIHQFHKATTTRDNHTAGDETPLPWLAGFKWRECNGKQLCLLEEMKWRIVLTMHCYMEDWLKSIWEGLLDNIQLHCHTSISCQHAKVDNDATMECTGIIFDSC